MKLGRAGLLLLVAMPVGFGYAQDLAPRAYIITPIHSNAVTLTYSFYDGELLFDGTVPISDTQARVTVPVLSLFHSMRFFGRTANFTASLPYGVGNFRGSVSGADTRAYRSGVFDSSYRFSVNLKGGPAMDVGDFRKWRQKTLIGLGFKLLAPTGQYDPTNLINYGANRWAFRPELGLSLRWGHWVLDTYGAVRVFPSYHVICSTDHVSWGSNTQAQHRISAPPGHLSHVFKPCLSASRD